MLTLINVEYMKVNRMYIWIKYPSLCEQLLVQVVLPEQRSNNVFAPVMRIKL